MSSLGSRLDLTWIEAFVVTVLHRSLKTAAQKLGVSRATLRSRVEALESHVGQQLLVRTVRGVTLTDAGERLLAPAQALLADANALSHVSDEHRQEVTGDLRVRAPVGMPPLLHSLVLSEIRRRYPGVRIHLDVHPDPTSDASTKADFVLYFGPRVVRGDFRTLRISSFPAHLLASRAYLAERGTPQKLDDLREHALLSWIAPGEDGTRWPLKSGGWVRVEPAVRSPEIDTVRGLANAGLGIAFVPDAEGVHPLIRPEDLELVLPALVGAEMSLWLLVPDANADAGRTRAALQVTKDIAAWAAQRALRWT